MHPMAAGLVFVPTPDAGRVYRSERLVRLADAGPDRRARLDALARFLQDVAEDDASDAALPSSVGWVLRKTTMIVTRFPALGETVQLETFCSAVATRWAERTTTMSIGGRAVAQAVSVWVAIDTVRGTPARLDDRFTQIYGASAAGRRASARLSLPAPPDDIRRDARPWPLRSSDFDVWGHVNNSISWAAVEDALDTDRWGPLRAEVEHVAAIEPDARVALAAAVEPESAAVWLVAAPHRHRCGDGGGGTARTAGTDGTGDGDGTGNGDGTVYTAARLGPIEP